MEKIKEIKSWLSGKMNKINKHPASLTKRKREKTQITTIRNEREDITTDPKDMKRIIKEYYEQFYVHEFDKPDEMDQFLEK